MLARNVREDQRVHSFDSLQVLRQMQQPCAVRELVGLMDLPDGNWVNYRYRDQIWDSTKAHFASIADMPPYDPKAPVSLRSQQKQVWIDWLDRHP
jgi:hypothetical protein